MAVDNCIEFYQTFPKGLKQIVGSEGNDVYFGRSSFNNYNGAGGNDYILTVQGRSLFSGGDGSDYLVGGRLNDLLSGDAGDDFLWGGGGNDCLIGGAGHNVLVGGGGSDTFDVLSFKSAAIPGVFYIIDPGGSIDGVSRVRDFQSSEDTLRLDLQDFGFIGKLSSLDIVASDGAAATSEEVLVYNETNGKLFLNLNGSSPGFEGSGGLINYKGGLFAVLSDAPELTFEDLIVIQ